MERFQEEGGAHEVFGVSAREQLPPIHFTELDFSDLVKQFPVIPYRDIDSEGEDEVEVKEEREGDDKERAEQGEGWPAGDSASGGFQIPTPVVDS